MGWRSFQGAELQYNSLEKLQFVGCVCVCVCVGSGLNSACVWRRGRSWGTGQGHNAYKTSKDQGSQGATEGFSSGERLIVIFEKDHSAWHLVESGQNRRLGSCHHKTA